MIRLVILTIGVIAGVTATNLARRHAPWIINTILSRGDS